MCRISKDTPLLTSAPKTSPAPVSNMAAMTSRLGLDTVAAAWPTGVLQLAQAVVACQRCEAGEVCTDWLACAPAEIGVAPAFCPYMPEFKRAKRAKERG